MPEEEITSQEQPVINDAAGLEGELMETRAALARAQSERDRAVAAAQDAAAEVERRAADSTARIQELEAAQLAAHRRAILAEHRGQVIDELIAGDSVETLEASVEVARAAYSRVVDAVRAQSAQPPPVPAGASPRTEPNADELSALQKIQAALGRGR